MSHRSDDIYAIQDRNQFPAGMIHSGTEDSAVPIRRTGQASGAGNVTPFGTYDVYAQDASTEAMTTIDYAHHEVHSGSHYYIEGCGTLAEAAVLRVKLVVPDSKKWPHFTWNISSSGPLETMLYEGASGGMAGGGTITPVNNNRNGTNVSGVTIMSAVGTAVSDGTLISQGCWGAEGRTNVTGGGRAREDELILKQDTTYLRKFISGIGTNIVSFKATWYEHTDKN